MSKERRRLGIDQSIQIAWGDYKCSYASITLASLLFGLVFFIEYRIGIGITHSHLPHKAIAERVFHDVVWVIGKLLSGGSLIFLLKIARDRDPHFEDIFAAFRSPWKWIIVGLFLLVIDNGLQYFTSNVIHYHLTSILHPRHYRQNSVIDLTDVGRGMVALVFYFVEWSIADGDGVLEAFRKNFELIRGNVLFLLGFTLLTGLVAILGGLVCCVGYVASVPVFFLAQANMYLALSGQMEWQDDKTPVTPENGDTLPEPPVD